MKHKKIKNNNEDRVLITDIQNTGYSEYLQLYDSFTLTVNGDTVSNKTVFTQTLNDFTFSDRVNVQGTLSANALEINGNSLAVVAFTGNYYDLLNLPVGNYAQLNNTSVQVWTGPQLFSQIQSSDVDLTSIYDLTNVYYLNNIYPTYPHNWLNTITFDGNHTITGLPLPVDSTDAANKAYVDANVGSGVKSISNTDGKITIDNSNPQIPIIGLNTAASNTWTSTQNFDNGATLYPTPSSSQIHNIPNVEYVNNSGTTVINTLLQRNNTWTGTNTFNSTTKVPTISGTIDNTTSAASTAFVQAVVALKAPLDSPAFTGIPTAPTATNGTNTTQIATTAFVKNQGYQPSLGYTPVQQGGGTGQLTDKLYMGWGTNSRIKVQVDSTDMGNIVTDEYLNNGTLPASFTTALSLVDSGSMYVSGTGDSNGYGFTATTPNGIYAPDGDSQLGIIVGNSAYGGIALNLSANSNGTGLYLFNGGGANSGAPVRGYDSAGMGYGLNFTGLGNGSKIYYEKNNSEIATLNDVIGINQTWQDVISSRSLGVTYTNTTGKAIVLNISVRRNSISTVSWGVSINGGSVMPVASSSNSSGFNAAVGNVIIVAGATYSCSLMSEPGYVDQWFELR